MPPLNEIPTEPSKKRTEASSVSTTNLNQTQESNTSNLNFLQINNLLNHPDPHTNSQKTYTFEFEQTPQPSQKKSKFDKNEKKNH